eukprot:5564451-Pleurochrysis_carterae.AAC.1
MRTIWQTTPRCPIVQSGSPFHPSENPLLSVYPPRMAASQTGHGTASQPQQIWPRVHCVNPTSLGRSAASSSAAVKNAQQNCIATPFCIIDYHFS